MTWTGPRRWPGRSPTRAGKREALAGWPLAAAGAGDLDRAEALARAITDPDEQARALADAGAGGGAMRVTWTGPRR